MRGFESLTKSWEPILLIVSLPRAFLDCKWLPAKVDLPHTVNYLKDLKFVSLFKTFQFLTENTKNVSVTCWAEFGPSVTLIFILELMWFLANSGTSCRRNSKQRWFGEFHSWIIGEMPLKQWFSLFATFQDVEVK